MPRVSILHKGHVGHNFDCGNHELNDFFKKYAWQSQASNVSRTYVLSDGGERVIGYYSLVYGSVSPQDVAERIQMGTGRYPLPIILIARLAIDKLFQGKGFGKALLKDAFIRCLHASEIAGLRAVVVKAKNETAKRFYEKFGFESSPLDEFHLFLLMKDLRKNFE